MSSFSRKIVALVISATTLILLVVFLFSFESRNDSVYGDKEGKTIYLRGQINKKMFEDIDKLDLKKFNRINIESAGGDKYFAFKILEIILYEDFDLVVRNYCASACASTIFVGSRKRFVEKDSIVALHGSSTAFKLIQENLVERGVFTVPPSENLKKLAAIEQQIAQQSNVDPRIFILPLIFSDRICFSVDKVSDSRKSILQIGWVPGLLSLSRDAWSELGVDYVSIDAEPLPVRFNYYDRVKNIKASKLRMISSKYYNVIMSGNLNLAVAECGL